MTDDLTQLRADAPERIGLIRSPFGWRFWTREADGGLPADAEYVRADALAAAEAENKALREVLKAAEELISERANPAPDYTFRAALHRRLGNVPSEARALLNPSKGSAG